MSGSLLETIEGRQAGICLYGLAPPKQSTPAAQLEAIVAQQIERLRALPIDGLIVYDLQDESERTAAPRPFPFLPTIDPETYAQVWLAPLGVPKIVYRRVSGETPAQLSRWLRAVDAAAEPRCSVLVGAAHHTARMTLPLADAYALARRLAPRLVLGGIAIAERHGRRLDEHARMLRKTEHGCRFFVTQAVYDVTSTKSLLSDYALALARIGAPPVPVILTFAPCGSEKTLDFMKWLGIAFPRWLENDLRFAADPLATSLRLCERIFAEAWEYAAEKRLPLGINVESVSIRKAEIDASVELLHGLRNIIGRRG